MEMDASGGTIRWRLIAAAQRGARALGHSGQAAQNFVLSAQTRDGGFAGRDGRSDLYYTTFALQTLCAMNVPPPPGVADYLNRQAVDDNWDLVAVSCLVRCLTLIGPILASRWEGLVGAVKRFASADGGFATSQGAQAISAYGCFLALAALEDLGAKSDPASLADCLAALARPDGGYANNADLPIALTPSTAAALEVLRSEGRSDAASQQWLMHRVRPDGGLSAGEDMPQADLLSTAVGLHVLDERLTKEQVVATRSFVQGLQRPSGGFASCASDVQTDCEYTFYALLAMGNLEQERG